MAALHCGGGAILGAPALCSRIFGFTGRCGVSGYPQYGADWANVAWMTGAWEKVPIRILAVEADVTVKTTWWRTIYATAFVGNSFNADPMTPFRAKVGGRSTWFGKTRLTLRTAQRFPEDDGMQFPAGQPATHIHLDVHLNCEPVRADYIGQVAVWYTLEGAEAKQTPQKMSDGATK